MLFTRLTDTLIRHTMVRLTHRIRLVGGGGFTLTNDKGMTTRIDGEGHRTKQSRREYISLLRKIKKYVANVEDVEPIK